MSTTRWPSRMLAHRVELHLHAEVPDRLLRLDERPAHVVVADEAHPERDAGLLGVADRGAHAGVGHRHDDVGRHAGFARELLAEAACAPR